MFTVHCFPFVQLYRVFSCCVVDDCFWILKASSCSVASSPAFSFMQVLCVIARVIILCHKYELLRAYVFDDSKYVNTGINVFLRH